MRELTKQAIQKLQKETARKLAVRDFELFEELDLIADKVAGVSKTERRLLSSPYDLCGIKFYPMTVAKSLWFAEKVDEWDLEGVYQEAFLFWLLTLPLADAALDTYSLRKDADKATKRLSRKLHCTADEMTAIYHKCLGITDADSGGDATDTDYGGMVAVLLREYGGTPSAWLYETPIDMISALFKAYSDKVNAESDSSRSASAHGGKAVAPQWSAKMQSLKDFREKVNAIRAQWEQEDGE